MSLLSQVGHAHSWPLPKSVAVISGFPLVLPADTLKEFNMTPEQNTGGWGDVMANVISALEFKNAFPEVTVRLIVTLNDQDKSPYINRTRDIVLKSLSGPQGEALLDPTSRTVQTLRGIEIYFVDLPLRLYRAGAERTTEETLLIQKATQHIPISEVGVQFAANKDYVDPQIAKIKSLHLHFLEFGAPNRSFRQVIMQSAPVSVELESGPLSFGIYGADDNDSKLEWKLVQEFLRSRGSPPIEVSNAEIGFAHVGETSLIEDYTEAFRNMAKRDPSQHYWVFAKGQGDPRHQGNFHLIPLGPHSKALSDALIEVSTYSPMVTGDGTFSSALLQSKKAPKRPKSFLYEMNFWKDQFVHAFLVEVFGYGDSYKQAQSLFLDPHQELSTPEERKARVFQIETALRASELHAKIAEYRLQRAKQLDLTDNVANLFQMRELFEQLRKQKIRYADKFITWLTELAIKTKASDNWSDVFKASGLQVNVGQKPQDMLSLWYSIWALWTLEKSTPKELLSKAAQSWDGISKNLDVDANYELIENLIEVVKVAFKDPKLAGKLQGYSAENFQFHNFLASLQKLARETFAEDIQLVPGKRSCNNLPRKYSDL